ncbi:Eukaryotic DNA topoisomerase I, catalytic core [Devosia equisanguinis]|uniref:DNA topoisomerase n=1 Tax=Devosia equisanguinis TaxID=2490941 RepID=A0A3S4CFA5_9HYPH|nr:DNA topoisomerase IB [Devosia equisanguinis]VDS05909.1 Eukaryotic DNA topoisomerase I, catalytic core [Devosia equisanguinis]
MFPLRPLYDRMRADEIAPAPSLSYCSDDGPGWRRLRRGTGFSYLDADGARPDARDLQRIKALVIPPAWQDVWICKDASGHIQATGRDERGRKQYRYHADWTQHRSATKFETLAAFAAALPTLREQVEVDLRRRSLGYERVVASVVWLLDNSLIRVGNPSYARDNKSFGLTTLRNRHVEISGSTLHFRFKGKSGKHWRLQLADRRIARLVRSLQDLPGQHLFKYEGEEGNHAISSRDVNAYISNFAGPGFTSKHFRTWAATVRAFGLFEATERPETKSGQARTVNAIIDQVAARLGNTRTVCRQCYVHPAVQEHWQEGQLRRSGRLKPVEMLDLDEVETLHFLRRLGRG